MWRKKALSRGPLADEGWMWASFGVEIKGNDMVVTRGFTELTRVASKYSLQWLAQREKSSVQIHGWLFYI